MTTVAPVKFALLPSATAIEASIVVGVAAPSWKLTALDTDSTGPVGAVTDMVAVSVLVENVEVPPKTDVSTLDPNVPALWSHAR